MQSADQGNKCQEARGTPGIDSGAMVRGATATALLAAIAAGMAAGAILHATAPAPSADVGRGTEDAFTKGLHRRELPPRQAPIRWTTDRAVVAFENLPPGTAELEVSIAGHRGPAIVAADGMVLGAIAAGQTQARFPLVSTGKRTRTIQLEIPTFIAGDGRALGARLQRVTLRPVEVGAPGFALLAVFVGPAVLAAFLGRRLGWGPWASIAFASLLVTIEAAVLWPAGLVRAPYATRLGLILGAGLVAAAAFAWWAERRQAGAGRWALVGMTAAWIVQGVLATSPAMIVSDAVFHANVLARVAGGEYFPTSVTQHAVPFRFPYGVSFYAVLIPFLRAGIEGVALVRAGAAAAGIAASAALFVVLVRPYGAAAAGLAVLLLQTLPATFDVYSYGNLSNAFGQSATVLFFAWWAAAAPRRWVAGAVLLAVAVLAHLSSLIVAVVLVAALLIARRDDIRRDRPRVAAVVVGLALAAAYYAHDAGLVFSQLPRLLEGSGRGAAETPGLLGAAWSQVVGAAMGWGVAAMALAWVGRPLPRSGPLDRDLAAWWAAAGVLLLPAIVSPLEVRFLYALTPAVAAAAGRGAWTLHSRGGFPRAIAWGLLAVQAATGTMNLAQAVLHRYRP